MVQTLTLQDALNKLDLPGLDRNLFSSPEWFRVLEQTYGTKFYVKYIQRDGKVDSYIFYSVVKNFLEWKICMCSYCDYSDGLISRPEDWHKFFESLREEFPEYRIAIRSLRDKDVQKSGDFHELSREKFHYMDISGSLDDVWRGFNDSARAAVNQASRKGVVVKVCEKQELKKFYDLHLGIRKNKYKVFPQPYRFFDIIWDEYMAKDKGVLLGAYDPDGTFIGGNMYLICGDTLYYKFNTSSLSALQFRPNNLLFWEGIQYARKRDLKYIDLGSSGLHQTGLIRYKEHMGAESMDIVHMGFHPEGYKFSQKRILKLMTKTFTVPWMPDFMVKVGSHIIYPFLA